MNTTRNVFNLGCRRIVGWRNDYMIAVDTINRSRGRVDSDAVRLPQAEFCYAEGHTSRGGERPFSRFIRDKFDAPEETATADVADVGVLRQELVKPCREQRTHGGHVLHEVLFPDDFVHLECRRAGYRVALVCVPVYEGAFTGSSLSVVGGSKGYIPDLRSPTAFHEHVDNSLVKKESRNRLIPPSQALADRLDVGNDALLLPGMHGTRPANSAHLQ